MWDSACGKLPDSTASLCWGLPTKAGAHNAHIQYPSSRDAKLIARHAPHLLHQEMLLELIARTADTGENFVGI